MSIASEIFIRHKDEIRAIARRYPVINIRVFGSVLHGDDTDASDIDLLVDTLPEATLFDLGGLQDELQQLLGVQVDLLTPGDLPSCFRASVISEARPV
jgi:predicted nucleotidyltransferase